MGIETVLINGTYYCPATDKDGKHMGVIAVTRSAMARIRLWQRGGKPLLAGKS